MRKYSCLIVEDEPIAVEVLEDYLKQVPFLELKGTCSDAIYAMEHLQKEMIDLIFLDIHLPKLKGMDFIRTLKKPPAIIITSAYQEYALQGYELNVLDYLLKPIDFSRFLSAVNKLRVNEERAPGLLTGDRPHLFFNVNKKQVKVYFDEIQVIESLREYVRISIPGKTILTKMQLGEMESLLPKNGFLRVHRSFIVSRSKIEAFSTSGIDISGKHIPIGRNYKEHVLSVLENGKVN